MTRSHSPSSRHHPGTKTGHHRDHDIQADAQVLLRSSPYFALRRLECGCRDGVLTIRGKLPSFYLKQVAQVALQGVGGVTRIDNHVEVVEPSDE